VKRVYTFHAQRRHTCWALHLRPRLRVYLYPCWPFVRVLTSKRK
jgi:hypothetical protein